MLPEGRGSSVATRLRVTTIVVVFLSCLPVAGCAGEDAPTTTDTTSEWRGSVTTEGDVTTVVNESGSVWGGNARHVEEASIGVALGEEPYLFSRVRSLWSTDDEIYVLDSAVGELRVFDRDGEYQRTIGRPGQGPGEFQRPYQLAVTADGRILVFDSGPRAILVLSPDGEEIARWPVDRGAFLAPALRPMRLVHDGTVWAPAVAGFHRVQREFEGRTVTVEEPTDEIVLRRYGEEGVMDERPVPVPDYEPQPSDGRRPPFTPRSRWMLSTTGDVITGVPTEYRFDIHRPDGTRTVVRRNVPPREVDAEHFRWAVGNSLRAIRRRDPDATWDPEPPAHRPYYRAFLPDRTGRVWVVRAGPTEPVQPCDPDPLTVPEGSDPRPCFRTILTADVFDRDGKFLGTVDDFFGGDWTGAVSFVGWASFLDGDTALFRYEDDDGTIVVKRYRLVLPGNEAG